MNEELNNELIEAIKCEAMTEAIRRVRELLDQGADPNAKDAEGRTTLYCAARNWDSRRDRQNDAKDVRAKLIKLLLRRGASVAVQDVDMQDAEGRTILHWVAQNGYKDLAQHLLEQRANANLKDKNGHTPLSYAALNDRTDIVELLLKNGASVAVQDVEIQYEHGRTLLHIAAKNGRPDAAGLLLKYGASADIANNSGETPLQLAQTNGHKHVIGLLLGHKKRLLKAIQDGAVDGSPSKLTDARVGTVGTTSPSLSN